MLKFQKFIIAFVVILISLLIIDIFTRIPLLLYAGIILALIGLLAYGSVNLRSGFYCKALCSADMGKRTIALTFDDGPDKTVTPALLGLLKKENIQGAFFCIGKNAGENPDLLRKMDQDGHVIGSHSFSHHFFFDLFSSRRMLAELQKTEDAIEKNLNRKIRLFRPPYGVTNPPLARALRKKNYHIIGWSLRSKDTVIKNEDRLFERVTGRLKPGDIILFHDTKSQTVTVLEKFIKFAKENDFSFERLDKILGIEAYE
jgi:peptidoglycan/xylan/chitin deacetylase (PgdA/CDA1 family)